MNWFKRNGSTILSILATAGMIVTGFLIAEETPEANEREQNARENADHDLNALEVIGAKIPAYIPAILTGAGTITCILGANALSRNQQASLVSAYAVLDQGFKRYKGKVEDIFGTDANRYVEHAIQQQNEYEHDDSTPPWDEVQTFYFEPVGKFFERTMQQVCEAEYHINRNFVLRDYVTLNEFLSFLYLDPVNGGDDIGWNLYDGEAYYGYSWIDFFHRYYTTDDGLRVCAIEVPFYPHPQVAFGFQEE